MKRPNTRWRTNADPLTIQPLTKAAEMMMANDADWVADVKRWYFSSQQPAVVAPTDNDTGEIGYEAAHPALQSRHWPEAPHSGFADLS